MTDKTKAPALQCPRCRNTDYDHFTYVEDYHAHRRVVAVGSATIVAMSEYESDEGDNGRFLCTAPLRNPEDEVSWCNTEFPIPEGFLMDYAVDHLDAEAFQLAVDRGEL
jgi:hypothetical protein